MEFIIDASGAPAVKLSEGKYIQILPVTRYQFERFIWKRMPSWCDYEKALEETGRISPDEVTEENFASAFMTNVNFDEALEFSQWLGGRLPTVREWDSAYDAVLCRDDLFKDALDYIYHRAEQKSKQTTPIPSLLGMNKVRHKRTDESKENARIDGRIVKLLEEFVKQGIKRTDLNDTVIGELVCEYPGPHYGRIYLKYINKNHALVTGNQARKTRNRDAGFCVVFV